MQIRAMDVEPCFRALVTRTEAVHHTPKLRGTVHLDEMRHFMRGEIFENVARRQNEPPGKRQQPGRRARTPTARLIAHGNAPDGTAELARKTAAWRFQIAPGFAAQEVADAPVDGR